MSKFLHQIMRVPRLVMLIVACLVTVVAAVGILVSIYNSVSARMREIAILRALGATRMKVLALICIEAALIGVAGAALGFVAGHLISAIGSAFTERLLGQRYDWMAVAWEEPVFLLGVVLLTVLAGLVPAMKAYRTPVATNLVAT
jgi:putative ABC transport system permease protein